MGNFLNFVYQDFKYKLFVPSEYNSNIESPLLVMLHGCEQNPDDFAAGTNMNILAEKENFLVLYPDMNHPLNLSDPAAYNPFGCWNWFFDKNQHRGKGHPKLIYEMINEVKSKYKIDSNQVFAVGLSAGGSLACILGVTYPDVFNGIGICSGLAYDAANVFFLTDPMAEEAKKRMEKGVADPFACGNSAFREMGEYKKKMRVIVFHGICDTTVHPINAQQVIIQWAQTNFLVEGGKGLANVTPAQVKSDIINGRSYTQHSYNDGDSEPLLELWMIDHMGHSWSGGSPNGSYTDLLGPNTTEIIWNFLTEPQKHEEIEIPAQNSIPTSRKLLFHPLNELPAELYISPPVQTPNETAAGLPIETPIDYTVRSPDKSSSELIVESQNESPTEPSIQSKENFIRRILSKLMKRK